MYPKFLFFGVAVLFVSIFPKLALSQKAIDSLIKNLQNSQSKGVIINPTKFELKILSLLDKENCNNYNAHHYLWFKNKLVIQNDGSGKLYEINPGKNPIRLDKTCYEGYNFKAFNFVYQDTLLSLGGYGFWIDNGLLRSYDEKNGVWYIINTKKPVPFNTNSVKFYHDVANKKI